MTELSTTSDQSSNSWLARAAHVQERGLIVVLLIMIAALYFGGGFLDRTDIPVGLGWIVNNNFLRPDNVIPNVFVPMSWIAIMALGATCVIISGGIDLSVGAVMAASALATAAVLQYMPTDGSAWYVLPAAFAVAIGIGLLCGFVNGGLVVLLRMHPFIVTLGTLYVFRGVCLVTVTSKTLPSMDLERAMRRKLPDAFLSGFGQARIDINVGNVATFIQPVPVIVMLICAAAMWFYMNHTVGGRHIYAVGGNEEAARFSGLPVSWVKVKVYMIAGALAGVAGLVNLGLYGTATTNTAQGYELLVIAAAVVGGASLLGGRGTALGAILGALVIQLIDNGIFILREVNFGLFTLSLSQEYAKIISGVAIVIAVGVDRFSDAYGRRRLARARLNQVQQQKDSSA